jgi:hypothetical protein
MGISPYRYRKRIALNSMIPAGLAH